MSEPQRASTTGTETDAGARAGAKCARPAVDWHTLDALRVAHELATDPERGLDAGEAVRRFAEHGPNELPATPPRSPLSVFAAQFKNAMIAILLAALVPSFFLGHAVESVDDRRDRARRAWCSASSRSAGRNARSTRCGAWPRRARRWCATAPRARVPARELVPGDGSSLHAGDRVPADARLVEAVEPPRRRGRRSPASRRPSTR